MWGIFCGLLLASMILALNGQTLFGITIAVDYLPGLVFISGGVLLANIGYWQLSRQEWLMSAAVVGVFLLAIGYSVYVQEAHKPHFNQQNFTLTLTTPSVNDAIQSTRRRFADKLQHGAEVVLVGVQVLMNNRPPAAGKPRAWVIAAVERRPGAQFAQLHEFIARAAFEEKGTKWTINVLEENPPINVMQYLALAHTKTHDGLALVNNAAAIPPGAFALLDGRQLLPRQQTPPAQYLLKLLPDHAEIITRRGVVNKIHYPGVTQ